MADRPILFSPPMVRALLAGRKTQTRRLPSLARYRGFTEFGPSETKGYDWHLRDSAMRWHDLRHAELLKLLPHQVGDRLYVRERLECANDEAVGYPADGAWLPNTPWQWERNTLPSIHMPRRLSRLTLTVTDVRVQRLQEIGEEDALAEGVERQDPTPEDWDWYRGWAHENGLDPRDPNGVQSVWLAPGTRQGFGLRRNDPKWGPTPQFAFRLLWDSINAKRGYDWATNPWVVALTFTVEHRNIDAEAR